MKKITAKFPGKNILVVEDYIINQEMVKEMLELMECRVDVAENGKEAVDKHKSGNYDLVFMDVQMPIMDGYQATKAIREIDGKSKHTPIVAITANAMESDKAACLDSGMDDYISKPIKGENLENTLDKFLKQK